MKDIAQLSATFEKATRISLLPSQKEGGKNLILEFQPGSQFPQDLPEDPNMKLSEKPTNQEPLRSA